MLFRYDRKDPTSVAVSIAPEASLMLGITLMLLNVAHFVYISQILF